MQVFFQLCDWRFDIIFDKIAGRGRNMGADRRGGCMIVVEAAVEEDLNRILEIEYEAITPPWTHGALLSEIYRDDSFVAVARRIADGSGFGAEAAQPSGCVVISKESSPLMHGFIILRKTSEDEGELLQIAVDAAARRCGVADLLMSAALSHASENSIESVFLEVRKGNEPAISLYKKHGFSAVRIRKDYYSSPAEDALIMAWPDKHSDMV